MDIITSSSPHQLLINLSIILAQPTGISNYASNLLPHLKSLEPTLLTATHHPQFTCYPVPDNLTAAQGIKGHIQRLLWTECKLPKIYQKLKSHLLFSPLPEAPIHGNCRFVVMCHDLIPLRFPRRLSPVNIYWKYYIPQVLQQAEHIICNSLATAQDITHFYQIPADKITSIPLAHCRADFRHLNLPTSNYFLYYGRHDPHKNLHRLITAFAALANKGEYQLWLAGSYDKRYTPSLQKQVTELGITEQVKFLNYLPQNQLPIIINQAIALVFPSLWEGFGLPVLEAMACGTPVITSNVSALPEVADEAAILVNPHNIAEITAAMTVIANNQQLRWQLSHQGITRASELSWEKTGIATTKVLAGYLS